MDNDIKTQFKGPGEWLSQAHQLEDDDEKVSETPSALLE